MGRMILLSQSVVIERLITSDWKNKSLNIVAIDFIGNFNNIERHVVLLNK